MKKIGKSKFLSIIVMIILIVGSFLISGQNGLNNRYDKISYYKDYRPVTYNRLAKEYNLELNSFPAKYVKEIMNVKGELPLVETEMTSDPGIDIRFELTPLKIFGIIILGLFGISFLKVFSRR